MTAIVTGAGGMIGGHLVAQLLEEGEFVFGVDVKPRSEWWQWHEHPKVGNVVDDAADVLNLIHKGDDVYHLAEDMGGIGHIESHRFDCSVSAATSIAVVRAAVANRAQRLFFASSACVYNTTRQADTDSTALKESDAYPAMPEDGYGEAKLFIERVCRYAYEDCGLETRVARYHNVYGPHGTWDGGREKAPAALCRKVAQAKFSGDHTIRIWGDGQQTRSFMFIDDCVSGTLRIMRSDVHQPLNLGSSELVSIDQLAYLIADIAGITVKLEHDLDAPKGVRGRNSDNTLICQLLGMQAFTPLRTGLEQLYRWVYDQVAK